MADAYQITNQSGVYFLTFQVVGWVDIFSRQHYREIIISSFDYCRKNKGLQLFAYVIMTNHIHLIARSTADDLSGLVRDFKKFTSKQILNDVNKINESRSDWLNIIFEYHAKYNKRSGDKQLWTHENHAVEITDVSMLMSKLNYIHENPVRVGWVVDAEDYLYSSARNFAELDCLLQIDEI